MRIVHVSTLLVTAAGVGIDQQLQFEMIAAREMDSCHWETSLVEISPSTRPVIRRLWNRVFLPFWRVSRFLRIVQLSRHFDIVLIRHVPADFMSLLLRIFVNNYATVHHTKETDEIRLTRPGLKGNLMAAAERVFSHYLVKESLAIVAVTSEIGLHQQTLHSSKRPVLVFPNGIDPKAVHILDDFRDGEGVVNVGYLCSSFHPWHGLDKLVYAVEQAKESQVLDNIRIHLIGVISHEILKRINSSKKLMAIFVLHGSLKTMEYRTVLSVCDIGLASFALERNGLTEAASLKVREMLAMGLAVYSGHRDVALDEKQPFIQIVENPNLSQIYYFGLTTKNIQRQTIRDMSIDRIDKKTQMDALALALIKIKQRR